MHKPSKIHPSLLPKISDKLRCGNMDSATYYYHGDHLGSASWITNRTGSPVQHLQYMPYGEPFVNERTSSYEERFTFTGKERDSETGYSYFGARFYDSDLMTGWLSVDPQSDKFPNISPYAYCNWNPVKLVDPNGEVPVKPLVSVAKIVYKAYKIYKKTGKLTMNSLKKAGLNELVSIVDDINTIFSEDASFEDRFIACVDLVVGTEFNNTTVDARKFVGIATKNNYRKKLQDATGKTGKGYEAHHTLPQKYEEKFNEASINIHEPGNTVWRETDNHRGKSHQHIKEWEVFFNKNEEEITKEKIYEYRDKVEKTIFGNKNGDI